MKETAWGKEIAKEFRRYRRECQRNFEINDGLTTEQKMKKLKSIATGGKTNKVNFLLTSK